jgi:ribosome-associated protein
LTEDSALDITLAAVRAADDRKGEQILALAVGPVTVLADYFVIVTGKSRAQIRAISTAVVDLVKLELDRVPERIEGINEGGWVLVDYGEVIVHILMPQERGFYQLEAFWGQAKRLDLTSILESSPQAS